MHNKVLYLLSFVLLSCFIVKAQAPAKKVPVSKQTQVVDSFAYYDELFNELESFIDSITAPRSFATINVGINNGFFNYFSQSGSPTITSEKLVTYVPSIGYYHKKGLGLNASGSIINDKGKVNLFQYAGTASYDYLQNRQFITGLSYTRFFTKDSLAFYTSPLSNETYAYFSYRKWWLKPSVAVSYGWGSRTSVEERREQLQILKNKKNRGNGNGNIPVETIEIIETTESINDFSVTTSIKRDFYWLDVISSKDYVRVSPQLSLTSGTQKFGFNQVNNYNVYNKKSDINIFNSTENIDLSEGSVFQLLSLSARIKSEFSRGKFFVQPQLMFDYYFPAKEKNLSTAFAINTGLIL